MSDSNFTDLGFVAETTFGTTPSTALQLLRRTGGNITPRRETTTSEEIRSDLRAGKPVRTAERSEGDVNVEWSFGTLDAILEGLLMEDFAVDTPAVGSDQLVDGTTKKSFTFEDQVTDPALASPQYLIHRGCRIASVAMSLGIGQIVTGSFGVMGATPSIAQASAGTGTALPPSTTEVLNTVDMIESLEDAASGGILATLDRITALDISIERALREKREIGGLNPFDIGVGRLSVTGTITEHFESDRLMDEWFAFSDRQLAVTLTDTAGNSIAVSIPKLKMVGDAQVDVPGPDDDVLATYNFEAYADVGDAALISIVRTAA